MQVPTSTAELNKLGTNPFALAVARAKIPKYVRSANGLSTLRVPVDRSESPNKQAAMAALRAEQNPLAPAAQPAGFNMAPIVLDNATLLRGVGRGTLKIIIPDGCGCPRRKNHSTG